MPTAATEENSYATFYSDSSTELDFAARSTISAARGDSQGLPGSKFDGDFNFEVRNELQTGFSSELSSLGSTSADFSVVLLDFKF